MENPHPINRPSIQLKKATSEDDDFLSSLDNGSWLKETFTTSADVYSFLIVADQRSVGSVKIIIDNNCGELFIFVLDKDRRKGFGKTALQEACIQVFSENPNIDKISAKIRLSDAASLKVFRKSGFSQEDVIKVGNSDYHLMIVRREEYLFRLPGNYTPPFPRVLRLEPASSCNFKCIHCPTGLDMNTDIGIMSMDTFDKIFERIKRYHFRVIVLYHGGEPFLNPNLFEITKRVRPLADRIEFNSNGSIITEGIIDKILAIDMIDRISFSIDGRSSDENDKIRRGANFNKIAANIRKIIERKKKLGLTRPKIFIANTQIPETTSPEVISVPEFLKRTFDGLDAEINYKCTYALIWAGMPIKPGITQPDSGFCKHTFNTFTIRWNGDVVPCCYDLTTEMLMGNVLQQDPEEIWHNKRYVGLRKAIASFHPPKLCQGCEVLYPQAVMTTRDIQLNIN